MAKKPSDEQRKRNNLKRRLARAVRKIFPNSVQTPAQMLETAELGKKYLASGAHMDDLSFRRSVDDR